MKSTVYFWLTGLLCLSESVVAQQVAPGKERIAFKKGSQQVTLSYGYGQGYLAANRNNIQMQTGYYVANHLLIGVVGAVGREWIGELHSNNEYSAGPLLRYQFGSSRFSPFAEAAYLFGQPIPASKQAAILTPGLSVGLLSQVRLEASYRFTVTPQSQRSGLAQVGVTFLLGTKR